MTKTGVQEYVKKVMQLPAALEAAKKAKAAGEKYCMCPACQAGGKVLDNADAILV